MLDKRIKHGMYGTRIYHIWACMKNRCNNINYPEREFYGGRGIQVCKEWEEFTSFYKWALMSGYKNGLSIDRIDNNGNYEPSNCRWATEKEQANNRRSNLEISYKGRTMNLKEWTTELGLKYKAIHKRINNGWSVEDTFTKPLKGSL